jgi:hypothetical protein
MSANNDAVRELKWFILIVIVIGILWLAFGGLGSSRKEDPFIEPAQPLSGGKTYGRNWLSALFPFLSIDGTSSGTSFGNISPTFDFAPGIEDPNSGQQQTSQSGVNLYGADTPPGPVVEVPDTISIQGVNPEDGGKAENEYVTLYASSENKKKMLITGMTLKSRMTGKQQSIGDGVVVYYPNTLNSTEPVFLAPGETAYIISKRSPFGYSFKTNKCMGYLNKGNQNFVIGLSYNCPHILSYPLPARPNAFNDNCLDFLNGVPTCTDRISYPSGLQPECKIFVEERSNYNRCIADFKNDKDFLERNWRVYLGRDESLWKGRREIIDLLDTKNNILSTYTY